MTKVILETFVLKRLGDAVEAHVELVHPGVDVWKFICRLRLCAHVMNVHLQFSKLGGLLIEKELVSF